MQEIEEEGQMRQEKSLEEMQENMRKMLKNPLRKPHNF